VVVRPERARTAGPQPGTVAQSELAEGLAQLVADGLRPQQRLRALRSLGEAWWRQHRDVAHLTSSGAEVLASAVSRLPIREREALRARYGADAERAAGQLVDEAATLAGWVWTATAVIPAPARAVHIIKVLVHSAVEIRLVAELYAIYGAGDTPRDPAWLNLVVSAWAADRPMAAGAPVGVGIHNIIDKLRQAHTGLADRGSRLTTLRHRGRAGTEAVRRLGWRFRRRMRSHPSTWASAAGEPAAAAAIAALRDVVRARPGASPEVPAGPPTRHLSQAWSHHLQARAAAGVAGPAGDPAVLARLEAALGHQEQHLRWLGTKLRRPRPPAAGPELPASGTDPVRSAHTCAGLADDAIDLVEEAGSRPRRLPGWPVRLRNGLVYAVVALALAVPAGLLIATGSGDPAGPARIAVLVLSAAGVSLVAYGLGLFFTGRLFRPWLGGRVARAPVAGLAIAVTTAALTLASLTAVGGAG